MIDRIALGALPEKPHTVFRATDGTLLQEEMFTRGGFDGPFSYLYHQRPITAPIAVEETTRGFPIARPSERGNHPLQRRLYRSLEGRRRGAMLEARTPIVVNRDVAIYVARPDRDDDVLFANGDGDELFYVFEGRLSLESVFGVLEAEEGDYVHVPRSTVHRWKLRSPDATLLLFECRAGCFIPSNFRNPVGQLKLDAPYTHRDFKRPNGPIATLDQPADGPTDLVIKKVDRFSLHRLRNTPFDVVGWEGFAYPFAFPIEKYQPKTGLIHLPPTIHTTFVGPGFAVCSFVPRVTDTHPQAIPCPYPHSSVDCDEILFYVRGNFTSRRGVGPGCISLHPAGVAHGPHPGAYEGSIGTKRTDELAVMIDTFAPLIPCPEAAELEDAGYHSSWDATS
ncbi:MAG: homogentisate 1,2-dioxygenase [Deltaproteobacteria bacterium]|nr:homogentisate 1,2-dioxygenase [Deltaproteobacteria bacterium]